MLLFEPMTHPDIVSLLPEPKDLSALNHFWTNWGYFFAQYVEDPDILGQIQTAWKNFVESGRIWALGIGFVIGYMFRSFTS